jgi:hypothetical protein
MFKHILMTAALGALGTAPAIAQQASPPTAVSPYAPYDWLIGDWYAQAGPGMIREQITYGPNRSYVKYSVFTAASAEAAQHLHFEGIALWNGKTKVLDYLFAVEPGSGVQENGTIRAEADGSIVREVEFIDAKGGVGTFRQSFVRTGPNSAITTLLRKTATGWVPTFPGSEKIELTRRPG